MNKRHTNTIILHLSNLTPADATLEVMAEYLKILNALMGDIKGITFDKVKKGSAQLQMKASSEAQFETNHRINLVSNGGGTAEQQKYFEALQRQNAKQHTRASLRIANKVVPIPTLEAQEEAHTLTDYTEVEARIMQLGGLDATIPMMCTDRNGQRIRCNADIALARQLKEYLLEPTYLTLMGDGSWKKENNRWALTSLNVKTYKIDDSEEISDFSQLSDAAGSTWGQEKHPFHKLQIIQGKRADQ